MKPDKYDKAYRRGYDDGLDGLPANVPDDDTEVNYRDGYEDGTFKRKVEEEEA